MPTDPRPFAEDALFVAFYREHLEPLAAPLDVLRGAASRERRRRFAISGLLVVATVCLALGTVPPQRPPVFLGAIGALMIGSLLLGLWAWWPTLGHGSRLREQFLPRLVRYLGDLEYVRHPKINLARHRAWRIVPTFYALSVADQLRGSSRGVPLQVTDITLMKQVFRRSASGNRDAQVVPFFRGLLCELQLAQKCAGTTVFGTRGVFVDELSRGDDTLTASVTLGDEQWEVFTDDAGAATALLPHLRRDGLDRMRDGLEASRLIGSFHRDRLLLLVEQDRPLFDLSSDEESNFLEQAQRVYDRLREIVDALDRLSLPPALKPDQTLVRRAGFALPADSGAPHSSGPLSLARWGCPALVAAVGLLSTLSARLLQGHVPAGTELAAAFAVALILVVGPLPLFRSLQRTGTARRGGSQGES